jgi:hypothetical protein
MKSLDPNDSTGLIDAFEENRHHGRKAEIFIYPWVWKKVFWTCD